MIKAEELSAPISQLAPREISLTAVDTSASDSVPELSRQMERYHIELKGRIQRLEDLMLRNGVLVDAPADLREMTHLSGVSRNMGDQGCEMDDDKDSLTQAMTIAAVGNNDLSAAADAAILGFPQKKKQGGAQARTEETSKTKEAPQPLANGSAAALQKSAMLTSRRTVSFLDVAMRYEDNCYAKLVGNPQFDHACAFLIIASSLMVGIEVQYRTESIALGLDILGFTFVVLFSLELLLRLRARGIRRYFNGIDFGWSFFDVFCVLSSYLEIIVSSIQQDNSGSFLLVVRTLRVVRIARIIRVIRFLGKLRMMVYTMLGAIKMLGWAVLLLAMIMYMFAVVFTEAVKSLIAEGEDGDLCNRDQLTVRLGVDHWGDLYISMLTLFEAITGGVSWHEPLRVLKEISALYVFMFLFYICVTILTIMNVITGLCCDYAIQNAVTDRDDVIKQQIGLKDRWRSQFATIFKAMDEDGSGEVSSEELRHQLQQEEFQAYLMHLNISVDDAMELLEVLDSDHDGSISLDEFVAGCMRVKGQAKTIDLMKIMRECVLTRTSISSMEKTIAAVDEKLALHV